MGVAVLFARGDSHYKTLPECDVWDIDRDARRWPGGAPVIAHPPCRAWAGLRHMASPRADEKDLAIFAVACVRKYGGVLEHPRGSTLWAAAGLPAPAERDEFGGWTLPIMQQDFGHRAAKPTWLYIVGCGPREVPQMPLALGRAERVVSTGHGMRLGMPGYRMQCTKAERERTPPRTGGLADRPGPALRKGAAWVIR